MQWWGYVMLGGLGLMLVGGVFATVDAFQAAKGHSNPQVKRFAERTAFAGGVLVATFLTVVAIMEPSVWWLAGPSILAVVLWAIYLVRKSK